MTCRRLIHREFHSIEKTSYAFQITCNTGGSWHANSRTELDVTSLTLIDFDRIRETHAPLVWSVVARILKHQDDALDCFQDVFAEAIVRGRGPVVNDWGALLLTYSQSSHQVE
jgi:hypothetical protein